MSGSSYLWAWSIYLLAACGLMFACWRISAGWSGWLRFPLRALLAAILLVPASVSGDHDELAPAWLVLGFDALMQEDADPWRSGKPLVVFLVVALVVAGVTVWRARRAAPQAGEPDEAALDG